MPGKKQHHTVPESYLAAFAAGNTLACVNVRSGKKFRLSKKDASTGRYFYSIPGSEDPDAFEDVLAEVEGSFPPIRAAIEAGVWPLPLDQRTQLAEYMAVQVTRGRDHRQQLGGQLLDVVRGMSLDEPEEYARLLTLPGAPETIDLDADELPATIVNPAHLFQMILAGFSVPGMLKRRRWELVVFEQPGLITSDAPIVPVPDPRIGHDAPLGFENALVIQYPLTRKLGLWMYLVDEGDDATTGRLDRQRVGSDKTRRAFNMNTAMHVHEQLFHHVDDSVFVPDNYVELAAAGGRTGLVR